MGKITSTLLTGICMLINVSYSYCQGNKLQSFTPKEIWKDNNGVHINAHGGGVLFNEGKYYWFGEHKIAGPKGNKAHVGVHCYSSTDLYNWKDEGIALHVDPEGSGSDIETNDPLYYGSVEIDVPGTLERKDYMCDFVSSHVKIQVRMEGFVGAVVPGIGNDDNMNIALGMAHLPSFTDFGNVPSANEESTYYPPLSIAADDATTYVTQYNVLRLADDNDVMIQVLAGADRTLVQEFSLAEFMEKYDISVDGRKGDVTISILLRASSVGVEIVDWDREEVDPGFDKE